jgi:2,3-bisphosphoglycerate-independent phosphoglycerate mutase
VTTIPEGVTPASDVANLSILGYDPKTYYSGRAPLEAAHMGILLKEGDIAFRCNFVTVSDGKMADYSAGHISSKEAKVLIEALNKALKTEKLCFYPGVSYRHLLVMRGFPVQDLARAVCAPPHDILGEPIERHLPKGHGAEVLAELMERSKGLLAEVEINKVRIDLNENPATMIWLWGQGQKPDMPLFEKKFGVTGSVISAVDLIKGIGKIIVEGATGYYDTNYEGKARAALASLEKHDFVFVHVEATDEAGHNGDLRMKITCIERFDRMVVGPCLEYLKGRDDVRLMVLPDHATPVLKRKHSNEPVCVAMMGAGITPNGFERMSEVEARKSPIHFLGHQLMEVFLK